MLSLQLHQHCLSAFELQAIIFVLLRFVELPVEGIVYVFEGFMHTFEGIVYASEGFMHILRRHHAYLRRHFSLNHTSLNHTSQRHIPMLFLRQFFGFVLKHFKSPD
jgi:hypothetical protein